MDSIQEATSKGPFDVSTRVGQFLKVHDRDLPDERRFYGTKIVFAGAESKTLRDGLYRIGVRNILVSYFYLRGWLRKHSFEEIQEDFGRFEFTMLDSGGFTFLTALHKGEELGLDLLQYTKEYYSELERIGSAFSRCAEVDVPSEIGLDFGESEKLRLRDLGVPIFPVMQGLPVEHYERLGWFDNFPFIAMGSGVLKDSKYSGWLNEVFRIGREKGVLFHGFGATKSEVLTTLPFYSVDSTTWLDGAKFGTSMFFESGRIRFYEHTQKIVRRRYRKRLERASVFWPDIEADKQSEVNIMNALAWQQFAEHHKYRTNHSYWLTDDEKAKAVQLKITAFDSEGLIDRTKSEEGAHLRRLAGDQEIRKDDRAIEVLHCNLCDIAGQCPRYQQGGECGYGITISLRTESDLHEMIRVVLQTEYGRIMTGSLFEKAHGGQLDINLSREMQAFFKMVKDTRDIFVPKKAHQGSSDDEIRVRGSGAVAQMLASVLGGPQKEPATTINVTPESPEEPQE
jgi:hypothetical protein